MEQLTKTPIGKVLLTQLKEEKYLCIFNNDFKNPEVHRRVDLSFYHSANTLTHIYLPTQSVEVLDDEMKKIASKWLQENGTVGRLGTWINGFKTSKSLSLSPSESKTVEKEVKVSDGLCKNCGCPKDEHTSASLMCYNGFKHFELSHPLSVKEPSKEVTDDELLIVLREFIQSNKPSTSADNFCKSMRKLFNTNN
jgi:hypothetical protein